jgi:hypothetical protein
MTRSGALACLALALAPLAACASAPAEARPQRVAFVDYRNGTHLELVNETHTGRVEQYSEVRADASRKVQTDEVMQGLVEVLRERGFDRQARPGPAPRASDGQAVMALEITDGDRVEHVLGWRGMSADDRAELLALAQNFVALYNETYGLQAVEVREGDTPFENPVGPTRKKSPQVLEGQG